jgi:uncharacterized protein YbjQ (UPF0145 family)
MRTALLHSLKSVAMPPPRPIFRATFHIQGDLQGANRMIITTTPSVEGRRIAAYRGIVSGEAILGANVFRDFFASIRDVVGGRSGSYEKVLRDGRDTALREMVEEAERLGAHAIVGVQLDYGALGANEGMMMVTANGTAVTLE